MFTAFILLNKNFANQIVISAEDVYDKVTGDYEIPEDVSEIKINELQPENSTFYYNLLNENQKHPQQSRNHRRPAHPQLLG